MKYSKKLTTFMHGVITPCSGVWQQGPTTPHNKFWAHYYLWNSNKAV